MFAVKKTEGIQVLTNPLYFRNKTLEIFESKAEKFIAIVEFKCPIDPITGEIPIHKILGFDPFPLLEAIGNKVELWISKNDAK